MSDPLPAAGPSASSIPATQLPSGDSTAPPPPPLHGSLPERIGRYRILKLLGEGGMGSVYLAEDTQLRRPVALKVPRFAADVDPTVLERFYREARRRAELRKQSAIRKGKLPKPVRPKW